MHAPVPILATPTVESRKALLQAAYAQGLTWAHRTGDLEGLGEWAQYACLVLRYLNRPTPTILFYGSLDDHPHHTLVNSPRQFISYVKRHDWTTKS